MKNLKSFADKLFPLNDEELNHLYSIFEPIQLNKKEHLFMENDSLQHIYFLSEGVFRCYCVKEGKEFTTALITEPMIFAELLSIRSQSKTLINLQALENVTCYQANFKAFEQLKNQHINIKRLVFKLYEKIYIKGAQRQVSFIYDSQTERYNKFVEEKSEYIDKIPSQYIASYLGIQPETLSRIRRKSM